ncbi:hypothetical protein SS50377_25033 [Spironucleus salmonicida]|uniref:Transcription factor TFIIB cyclin-like domain-containing protein n=1 Tax=Spironucleus salmonicida TaxID=348837 RepID=V6LH91_9EUKA|nr:hypothetical protein SS50377_25033 [Spironucleus salmonicida]|eukprot:EST43086.1 hypothetical protein SS50377_17243 [Spironucleus salmonicida]
MECTHEEKIVSRYSITCATCGVVLEENDIVIELNFQKTNAGGFVGGEFVQITKFSQRARENSLYQFKTRTDRMSSDLAISQQAVNTARQFYIQLLDLGQTRSRSSEITASALLYLACIDSELTINDFAVVSNCSVSDLKKASQRYKSILKIQKQRNYDILLRRFLQQLAGLYGTEIVDKLFAKACENYQFLAQIKFAQNLSIYKSIAISIYLAGKQLQIDFPLQAISHFCMVSLQSLESGLKRLKDVQELQNAPFEAVCAQENVKFVLKKRAKPVKPREELFAKQEFEFQDVYELDIQVQDEIEAEKSLQKLLCDEETISFRRKQYADLFSENVNYIISRKEIKAKITKNNAARIDSQRENSQILSMAELGKEQKIGLLQILEQSDSGMGLIERSGKGKENGVVVNEELELEEEGRLYW